MIFILCVVLLNPLVCAFTAAAKAKSVNLNLETVLEFENKNLDKDVQIIDNVQTFLHKVRRVLDKSKDYRRTFNKDNVSFTEFLESVLGLLVSYSDDELEELAVVVDEELRKYHYKGCKFYELVKNQRLRDLIGDALEELRRTPARKMRKLLKNCIQKLQNRDFSQKNTEFVNYVNSLYIGESKEKMNNVFKRLQDFSKTGRRAHSELVQVVRNAIRTIFFDHYSDLNANARKDFRLKLDNFFVRYSTEDGKVEIARSTVSDLENDGSVTMRAKVNGKKARRNSSTTDITATWKVSKENKHKKLAKIFKDVKFIVKGTTKSTAKGQKKAREKASNTDDALKYKLSSEEDEDKRKGSISQELDIDIVDDLKTKPIDREERKPARNKEPALKYKLSSEEDTDGKKESMSRDIEITDETTKMPVKRGRSAREKTTGNMKKKRAEKRKHGKKESKFSDIEGAVPKSKRTKQKRYKPFHEKKKSKGVTLKRIYSSEDDEIDKKISKLDLDDEVQTKSNKRSTKDVSPGPYPVRDLDEEKKRMPMRFLSLFPETIPTTTEKIRPKKTKKLKKHKRSKSIYMRAESAEEPNWQSSESKKKRQRHGTVNKPESKMVVKQDRPLRDILTEHNAILKAESSPTHPLKNKVEKKTKHRKRKHGGIAEPKHSSQRTSRSHENHASEMTPVSSESDSTEAPLRKHFAGYGLAIESFENNVLDGHYLYRKQNSNDTFNKRSVLRKKANQEKEVIKHSKAHETNVNHETTRTHKNKHKHSRVKDSVKTDIEEIDKEDAPSFRANDTKVIVTTTTTKSRVSDDNIINKIHSLEKQLENVISNMDDNTESDRSSSTVTIKTSKDNNIHLTASMDNVSPLIVVNKDRIYENIETTPKVPSQPDTSKTTKVASYSSEQSESDNEAVFGLKLKNKTISTELSSPTVFITNKTDKISTLAKSIITSIVKSDDHIPFKDSTSSTSLYKSTATLKNPISSSTNDVLEVDDDFFHENNLTTAERFSKEKEKVSSEEIKTIDKASTKNDARKVNKPVNVLPMKFKTINVKLNEIETKTAKEVKSTKKEIKINNNTTKNQITAKDNNTKPTQTIEVTATKTTYSANKLKLNVTLPTEFKLKTDTNKTIPIKDANLIDKSKTNKANATVATKANLNGTAPSPTTLSVSEGSVFVSNAGNSTKAIPNKRRQMNYMVPENKDSPLDLNEEDWGKHRESSDLLYNWA